MAERVAARGGPTSEAEQRAWSADAFHAQEAVLGRLAQAGSPLRPRLRLTRALDGFVAEVDAVQALLLERDPGVEGVYPLRALEPLPLPDAGGPHLPRGLDRGAVAVTAIGRDAGAAALLARLVGQAAPGAAVTALPLPAATGRDAAGSGEAGSTAGRLLAALEAALDPSGDGDCHDGARVIVLGLTDPGVTGFPGSPVARALRGAAALGAVVVAPRAAGAAVVLAAARPGLAAASLGALLRQAAAPWPSGPPDLAAALGAEVALEDASDGVGTVLRNVSTRELQLGLGGPGGSGILAAVAPLAPGALRPLTLRPGAAQLAAAAGAAVSLLVEVRPAGGGSQLVAVALPAPPLPPRLALASGAAQPSDVRPARLTVTVAGFGIAGAAGAAGAAAASAAVGLARLDLELLRDGRSLGLVARLRELLPGRYLLALTGRGPGGARLAPGRYALRATAVAAAGTSSSQTLEWAITS